MRKLQTQIDKAKPVHMCGPGIWHMAVIKIWLYKVKNWLTPGTTALPKKSEWQHIWNRNAIHFSINQLNAIHQLTFAICKKIKK